MRGPKISWCVRTGDTNGSGYWSSTTKQLMTILGTLAERPDQQSLGRIMVSHLGRISDLDLVRDVVGHR